MKIDGIGQHVGYEKPDDVRDYYDAPVDFFFIDDNERRDVFGDNTLMIDENDSMTFFSGDDASFLYFNVTVHFLDRSFNTHKFMQDLLNAGIYDDSAIHTWEWNKHICGVWFDFNGDFNGGFAALDRFIKVIENFKLTYEYKVEIHKDSNGRDVPFDENAIMTYRSPFFGNDDSYLTSSEVYSLIKEGYIAPFSADKVKIRTDDGKIMTYGEWRTIELSNVSDIDFDHLI